MWLSFSCILEFPLFLPSLHNTCSCYYLHSQIDADKDSVFWLANLHPSWKKNRMHFYSIQVRSSFLIQVSCMVYTIKKLEWRLGCKTCIVYTGLNCNFGFEKYLDKIKNFEQRRTLTRFRISAHKLAIETGRYKGIL